MSVRHAAALSVCLRPGESLVLEKINPKNGFASNEWLLLNILNLLTDKPVNPFEQTGDYKEAKPTFTKDEYIKRLSLPRKEVE